MIFKLVLKPVDPTGFALKMETSLAGIEFMTKAQSVLRENLENITDIRHETLGVKMNYTIDVPSAIAAESTKFATTDTVVVTVPEGFLNNYIYYGVRKEGTMTDYNDPMIPTPRCFSVVHKHPSVTLVSRIDELAIVDAWVKAGYPDTFAESVESGSADTGTIF